MLSKLKILMVGLCALFALSAVGAGVAQAAAPVQPQFTKAEKVFGTIGTTETIKSNLTIEDSSGRSRLWATENGFMIRCERGTSSGTIGPKGVSNGEVTYKECKVFKPEENAATDQWEEGPELPGCKVKEGEIKVRSIKSHLVWSKTTSHVILVLYSPEVGETFVKITIEEGTELCIIRGTYEVKGSVLARVWRPNEEALMGYFTFDTRNQLNSITKRLVVKQLYTEWEVEQIGSGKVETGTAELRINVTKVTPLESIEQGELEKQTTRRGPWGIHE